MRFAWGWLADSELLGLAEAIAFATIRYLHFYVLLKKQLLTLIILFLFFMSKTFTIELRDDSGVEQLISFDFRKLDRPGIYSSTCQWIKTAFLECAGRMAELFPPADIHLFIRLESEKRSNGAYTLACFDLERSSWPNLYFRVYYDSTLRIAQFLASQHSNEQGWKQFISTVYHELIHAADMSNLQIVENRKVQDKNELHDSFSQNFYQQDLATGGYNVQWTLLNFFSVFRNEGIALLGEKLLSGEVWDTSLSEEQSMDQFVDLLTKILDICHNLKFYNSIESHEAYVAIQKYSLKAYEYADKLFFHLIKPFLHDRLPSVEILSGYLNGTYFEKPTDEDIIYFLQQCTQLDLSDFIQLVFTSRQLVCREKFLSCCAIIQQDEDEFAISDFSKQLLLAAHQGNISRYNQVLQSIVGYKMDMEEIHTLYSRFLQTEYDEDIVDEIRKKAEFLIRFAESSGDETALWALTYLLDEEDIIHDRVAYLGWQDDWIVLESTIRILKRSFM